MRRREFMALLSSAVAWPKIVRAQQPLAKTYRIGWLATGSYDAAGSNLNEAFRQELRRLGWAEGQNINIEFRFSEGKFDRLPDLAAELVRLNVNVIVAVATPSSTAAKNATDTIPIVMIAAGDPVELGLITNLARPGANVTGLSFSVGMETFGKGL